MGLPEKKYDLLKKLLFFQELKFERKYLKTAQVKNKRKHNMIMTFALNLVIVGPEGDGLQGGQQPVIHQARLQVLPGSHVVQQNLNTWYSST